MPLACFGQMDSLEYRLRSHIRTSLRTFYILKIVLLPRNLWQHIAYLKLNQPKIKATKFPQKIVCGNATDTALYISANGNAAETLRKRETRPHFALTCFRPPEMWRKLEPSDFRKISEIRKRLISPCESCGFKNIRIRVDEGLISKIVVSSIAVVATSPIESLIYLWHDYLCTATLSATCCWFDALFRARSY